MRQVNQDELVYMVASALGEIPASLLRGMMAGQQDARTRDRAIIASRIVERAFRRFEVLSADDLPEMMGELAFSIPVARMLGEEPPPLVYAIDE